MAIRESLQTIATTWPAYHKKRIVDGSDPVFTLVTRILPDEIRLHLPGTGFLEVEGSTGQGNITAAPWVGVFDPRITSSATVGYYVVYLYSVDLKSVTLCIAFGTTQFERQFGQGSRSFKPMRDAALRLQDLYQHSAPASLSRAPINLAATPAQRLHYAYEQAAIFSLQPYQLDGLPSEQQLIGDLKQIVGVYTSIVADPLTPSLEDLLQATIQTPKEIKQIEIREFEPRPPKAPSPAKGGSRHRRYSPESRKVGSAGEKAVLEFEREKLTSLGRPDLVKHIRWHTERGEFPGWDITSFDEAGNEIFIEVKATIGRNISAVNITTNEWEAAKRQVGRYLIYLVTDALSETPSIERLKNPYERVEQAQLQLEPIVYELSLTSLKIPSAKM
jgi:hypothetical protein